MDKKDDGEFVDRNNCWKYVCDSDDQDSNDHDI